MTFRSPWLRVIALLVCTPAFATPAATVASQLRKIEQDLTPYTVRQVHDALPPVWAIGTADGNYFLPAASLRVLLENTPPAAISPARQWLDVHATELERLAIAPQDSNRAPAVLRAILAQEQFAPPRPQSLWDRIRERLNLWIAQLVERLFGSISRYPVTGTIVFWAALAGAVSLLVYWLITLLRSRTTALNLTAPDQASPRRTSSQWLSALSEANERGDLRTAVQCAYWAGIARLQDTGALPTVSAKTPREFLRLLASDLSLQPLRTLTSSLERIWYGCAEATPVDLSTCMKSLEELGCRWD